MTKFLEIHQPNHEKLSEQNQHGMVLLSGNFPEEASRYAMGLSTVRKESHSLARKALVVVRSASQYGAVKQPRVSLWTLPPHLRGLG